MVVSPESEWRLTICPIDLYLSKQQKNVRTSKPTNVTTVGRGERHDNYNPSFVRSQRNVRACFDWLEFQRRLRADGVDGYCRGNHRHRVQESGEHPDSRKLRKRAGGGGSGEVACRS